MHALPPFTTKLTLRNQLKSRTLDSDTIPTTNRINKQLRIPIPIPLHSTIMVAECIRKLAIWHTPTFTTIITHDELDCILSPLGFVPLPPGPPVPSPDTDTTTVWKEYLFSGAGVFLAGSLSPPPRPRLPYPKIDGLHLDTYRLFLESVDFYLCKDNISDLFHVRGMPLHLAHDRHYKWLHRAGDDLVYMYREGTTDLTSTTNKKADKIQKKVLRIVPLKNITDKILQL